MNIGMMWLDDDKRRSFEEKVRRAAEYYQNKYGRLPELCFVNSSMIGSVKEIGTVEIKPTDTVMPSHFWLGMKAQG